MVLALLNLLLQLYLHPLLCLMHRASEKQREQAKLLNQIIDELLNEHNFSEKKLKELLGHTRLEVLGGVISGIVANLILFLY